MKGLLQQKIDDQIHLNRYRQRVLVEESFDCYIKIAGKTYVNFSSNDYLGLNNHPVINKAMQEGIDQYGLCASGSNLITGFSYAHSLLEETICYWLNKPKCLLFSSGFAANLGVLQALGNKEWCFWLDKLSHASLIDGAYSTSAKVKRFLHNDIEQLTLLIEKSQKKKETNKHLIVSEGVFSMDGDKAKVASLSSLAKQTQALLYLDDAHSIGVIGKTGQGSVSEANIDIVMATFGKAIATSGAFVACDETIHEYLVNFSRHYIYTTAMSPALAWATKASIDLIQQETWRREKIKELSEIFKQNLNKAITLLPSDSSIHAVVVGSEKKALRLSYLLKEAGLWVSAIRPPTVANNKSRLRITICANHKEKDIKHLANILNENIN